MKKLIAMLCVLAMLTSMVTAAFAATEPSGVILSSVDIRNDLYEAVPVKISDSYKISIPAGFTIKVKDEVTTLTDGTHTIEITSQAAEDCEYNSLADAKKAFIDAELQNTMVEMVINGMLAIGVITEEGTYMDLIETPDGQIITLKFLDFDTTDNEYMAWVENMLKSITVLTPFDLFILPMRIASMSISILQRSSSLKWK